MTVSTSDDSQFPAASPYPVPPAHEPAGEFAGQNKQARGTDNKDPDGLTWHKLHRLTPFVRGWIVIVAIAIAALQTNPTEIYSEGVESKDLLILLGIAIVVGLGVIFFGWLSWRRMSYAYDYESVYMKRGILFRQERKVRLDRIQTIDIVRPVIARILGLAELTVQSAAGGTSNVSIGFLKDEDADKLRAELLARASGAVTAERDEASAHAGAAGMAGGANALSTQGGVMDQTGSRIVENQRVDQGERVLFAVPPKRIILGALLSGGTIATVILVAVAIGSLIGGYGAVTAGLLPALLAFVPMTWNRFVGEYGFTGAISADGIRVRHGLLETRAKTIPPGRVQAVQLRQSLLWRKPGWWRVDVNVAGQAIKTDGNSVSLEAVLLPVGTHTEAIDALWLVLPDLGTDNPIELLDHALNGVGPAGGFTVSPRSARWLDWFSYTRNGFVSTEHALIIRTGWLIKRVVVVPHVRIQSIGAQQGPWQRKLRVATFTTHSTVGNIRPLIPHQSEEAVRELLVAQAARAREARVHAGPEQWLERVSENYPQLQDLAGMGGASAVPAPEESDSKLDLRGAGTTHTSNEPTNEPTE